ncbi:U2 small nuclear RNA auxiliary factor 1 like 4 [Homo sapiens]|uniref:U2 small nuclear RNA auxiliary factor 1 like 4 n=1 Tax=Homo sapiens TaxID=9606 RepID=K7EJM7_HUMAN|nr:U2 small nuclear RNA auxiliary factor 1 like 4 [Homo sapiens]KAI4042106.1 U2 small nuclear RNA auxiliary factor 1 like 4 [Homo sapiens]
MAEYLASIFGTEKDKSGSAGTGTGAPGFTTSRHSARRCSQNCRRSMGRLKR